MDKPDFGASFQVTQQLVEFVQKNLSGQLDQTLMILKLLNAQDPNLDRVIRVAFMLGVKSYFDYQNTQFKL